jgi:WD40 repeat protein
MKVLFTPDGSELALGYRDGSWIFEGSSGVVVRRRLSGQPNAGQISPDGTRVVTASYDHTARMWSAGDEDTGRLVASLTGSRDAVTSAVFSPDGRFVATLGDDGRARLWNVAVENQLETFTSLGGEAAGAATVPGDHLVLAWGDAGARLSRTDGRAARWLTHTPVDSVAFAPDGRAVFVTHGDSGSLLRLNDGHLLWSFAFTAPVTAAAFSPDGRRLAVANGYVVSVFPRDGNSSVDLGHGSSVTAVAYSPDGRILATGTSHGVVALWRGYRLAHVLRGHRGAIVSVRFSRDGGSLVSASRDGTARIWGVDGTRRGVLRGHAKPLTSARFSPDGREVVTASEDAEARIWSVVAQRTLHRLRGAFHTVSDASFSDDGRWVIGAGPRTALLWNARTGDRLAYLRGPTAPVVSALWLPGSHVVLVASRDGTIRKYVCDICGTLPQLVSLAEKRLAAAR